MMTQKELNDLAEKVARIKMARPRLVELQEPLLPSEPMTPARYRRLVERVRRDREGVEAKKSPTLSEKKTEADHDNKV